MEVEIEMGEEICRCRDLKVYRKGVMERWLLSKMMEETKI